MLNTLPTEPLGLILDRLSAREWSALFGTCRATREAVNTAAELALQRLLDDAPREASRPPVGSPSAGGAFIGYLQAHLSLLPTPREPRIWSAPFIGRPHLPVDAPADAWQSRVIVPHGDLPAYAAVTGLGGGARVCRDADLHRVAESYLDAPEPVMDSAYPSEAHSHRLASLSLGGWDPLGFDIHGRPCAPVVMAVREHARPYVLGCCPPVLRCRQPAPDRPRHASDHHWRLGVWDLSFVASNRRALRHIDVALAEQPCLAHFWLAERPSRLRLWVGESYILVMAQCTHHPAVLPCVLRADDRWQPPRGWV